MQANFQEMSDDTSLEGTKNTESATSTIDKIKKEAGPVGFIGAIVGIIVLVGVGAFFFIDYQKDQKNAKAQDEIFQAQYYYEKDSLEFALLGDGRNLGFLDIIEAYSGTEVANLAYFYAGAAYLKQRKYAEAIEQLEQFNTAEDIIQARAYSLLGHAYLEQGNFTDAANNYMKAANRVDDKYFSPEYLMNAALAYEKAVDLEAAVSALEKITKEYKDASTYNEARKHKTRLEVLATR